MIRLFKFFTAIAIGSVSYGIVTTLAPVSSEQVSLNQTVGYVEVSPGVCEANTLVEDNQIYTFQEDCNK